MKKKTQKQQKYTNIILMITLVVNIFILPLVVFPTLLNKIIKVSYIYIGDDYYYKTPTSCFPTEEYYSQELCGKDLNLIEQKNRISTILSISSIVVYILLLILFIKQNSKNTMKKYLRYTIAVVLIFPLVPLILKGIRNSILPIFYS